MHLKLPLNLNTAADIQRLVDEQVHEQLTLEYKGEIPHPKNDEEIRKFAKDIAAMANSAGGIILYGVHELKKGERGRLQGPPDPAKPLGIRSADKAECERLQQLANSNISPNVPGLTFHPIEISDDVYVIACHVPRSWIKPHMILNSHDPFWIRLPLGNHQIDMPEVRRLVLASDRVHDDMRSFRARRVAAILSGDTPIDRPQDRPRLLAHLLPLSAFDDQSTEIPAQKIERLAAEWPLALGANSNGAYRTFNEFGVLMHLDNYYGLVFRNGCIESVTVAIARGFEDPQDSFKHIRLGKVEIDTIDFVHYALRYYKAANIQPPYYLSCELLGVSGYTDFVPNSYIENKAIRRNTVSLPQTELSETLDDKNAIASVLRPIFDIMWQAIGVPRCFGYDDNGTYKRL